ncbi:MAG: ATP phosphoribosyltransferase regulatory subunit [Fretibacterium sp.]|nr:ATP phosphoribosyltransferase regulatory subunit [Fretibacterium sp.]
MNIDITSIKGGEQAILALRSLYEHCGYTCYRMSKFEEYDFYAQNRDFLPSGDILTFTDTDGRLMALKPDVTLSIVRHVRIEPGTVQKIFYDENVYRAPRRAGRRGTFREIPQVGLECLGAVDDTCIREVLSLAAESLSLVAESRARVLDVSHLGVLSAVLEEMESSARPALIQCVAEKNLHELTRLCGAETRQAKYLRSLVEHCGRPQEALPALRRSLAGCAPALDCLNQLERILCALGNDISFNFNVDFSVVSNLNYYNGLVFRGFIDGIPAAVLSGGQYDRLMGRMGHTGGRAIGFAVYMDLLDSPGAGTGEAPSDSPEPHTAEGRGEER